MNKIYIPFLSLVAMMTSWSAPKLDAQIQANFDAGNTSSEVDGYPGMAGDGWTNAWSTASNNFATFTGEVLDTNPLAGGGNYLHGVLEHSFSSARSGRFSREYTDFGVVDLNQPHIVSFYYRLDSGISDLNRPRLFDDNTGGLGQSANTSWKIRTSGVQWRFDYWDPEGGPEGDGANVNQPTGMNLFEGDVYRFEIRIDPASSSYIGFIENLDHAANDRPGPASFTTDPLRFMSGNTNVHGFLNFVLVLNDQDGDPVTGSFSIDGVTIIPEPGSLSLAALAGLLLFGRTRHRRRNSV